jgi:hypothetical protein
MILFGQYVQSEALDKDGRNADDLLFAVIEEYDPGFGPDDLLARDLVGEQIGYIAPLATDIGNAQVNPEDVTVKSLGLEYNGCIGDQDSVAVYIPFFKPEMVKKAGPGLLGQGQNGIVAHMSAEIDVIDAQRNFSGKYMVLGNDDLYPGHVSSLCFLFTPAKGEACGKFEMVFLFS